MSFIRNSLLIKGVLSAVLIITIVFALLTPSALRLLDSVAEDQINNHISELAVLLNSTMSVPLFSRNTVIANEVLEELVKHQEQNLVYILVYDDEGNLFSRVGLVNPELLPSIDDSLFQARKDGIYDRQNILKLDNEILGKIRYGLSLRKELMISTEIRKQGTTIIVSALLATAALFSLFGVGLTRQLKKLIVATHTIAEGDYTNKVKVTSKDEIGQLSLDFNTMVDAVRINTHTIQENKRFLQGITDNIEGMIYRCNNNRQWTLGYVSAGAEKLTGYNISDLITDEGFDFSSLIIEDDREHVWNEIQEAFSCGEKFSITYRIKTGNGDIRWVLDRGGQIENDESLIEGIIVDITAQKQAEEERQKSEERLSNIIGGSLQGIFVHCDGKPIYANDSFVEMFGYNSAAEVLALDSVTKFISPNDQARMLGYRISRANKQNAPQRYEFEGLKKDGSSFMVKTMVSSIDWDGTRATQHTIIDISLQKNAEHQSTQYLEQLAQLNRVNVLGEMTAGIAHELNQPLTSIVTRSGAARRRLATKNPDMAKIDSALEAISEQALRAGNVMQRMRDLVELHQSERGLIDPNKLIEESLKIVNIDNSMIHTQIETRLSSDLPLVRVDKIQIQQVILNLLRNAQDAMQQLPSNERIIILISTKLDENFVKITVTDRGEGIDAETESKLLNSFFTTKKTGMGMGLSISRTIITAHSGQLWFSRNEDRGVSFHITLPTAQHDKND